MCQGQRPAHWSVLTLASWVQSTSPPGEAIHVPMYSASMVDDQHVQQANISSGSLTFSIYVKLAWSI